MVLALRGEGRRRERERYNTDQCHFLFLFLLLCLCLSFSVSVSLFVLHLYCVFVLFVLRCAALRSAKYIEMTIFLAPTILAPFKLNLKFPPNLHTHTLKVSWILLLSLWILFLGIKRPQFSEIL